MVDVFQRRIASCVLRKLHIQRQPESDRERWLPVDSERSERSRGPDVRRLAVWRGVRQDRSVPVRRNYEYKRGKDTECLSAKGFNYSYVLFWSLWNTSSTFVIFRLSSQSVFSGFSSSARCWCYLNWSRCKRGCKIVEVLDSICSNSSQEYRWCFWIPTPAFRII